MAVPAKKVGGYVNCPRCAGRLWVQETPNEALPPAPLRPMPLPPALTPLPAAPVPAAPEPPPAAPRKVARLVTSEAAPSNLTLPADGQLPVLHLDEPEKKQAGARPRSVHPAVLFAVLAASAIMTLVLAFGDFGSPPPPTAAKKDEARQEIREKYFGGGKLEGSEDPLPYQICLREAQQAHSRGNRKAERDAYRKVLDMLRAAPAGRERGLTGSKARDEELEKLIVLLLSEK
jgi:hypothetical protein